MESITLEYYDCFWTTHREWTNNNKDSIGDFILNFFEIYAETKDFIEGYYLEDYFIEKDPRWNQ